jgi:hypothetical protein
MSRKIWRGLHPCLYGLLRLGTPAPGSSVTIVEGESDCQTLWLHGIQALGLPGANNWKEDRDAACLDGYDTIYVVDEGDQGGQAIRNWLSTSRIRSRVKMVRLGDSKDPSALHIKDPSQFLTHWQAACDTATPWVDQAETEAKQRAESAWLACKDLAEKTSILDAFAEDYHKLVAGEDRAGKLLFLAMMTRYLKRPVSAVVKGASSAGKSWLTAQVLGFFPPEAYYTLSGVSEKALAYSEEPLSHRFLVMYEAAGLQGDFASYLMRSLLSEGRVRYETVEKTPHGLKPRLIEREGPTGLVVTTTAVALHPENETRLLSVPVNDTPEQTVEVLKALAAENQAPPDFTAWHALQAWLASASHEVTIPFALGLAERTRPAAIRLRRDFGALLTLIRAHALLHRATRQTDGQGRVVATLDDYAAVRALVIDLLNEGVEVTVPDPVKTTVAAVKTLTASHQPPTSVSAIARYLKVDRSTASRRVSVALEGGYLRNLEDVKGRPFQAGPGGGPAEPDGHFSNG